MIDKSCLAAAKAGRSDTTFFISANLADAASVTLELLNHLHEQSYLEKLCCLPCIGEYVAESAAGRTERPNAAQ